MASVDKKVESVRQALGEEFSISTETSGGFDPETGTYGFYTRDIYPHELQEKCGLNYNQLLGIFEILQEEDFILGFSVPPEKNRLVPDVETLQIAFPLSFVKEVSIVSPKRSVFLRVLLDKITRDISLEYGGHQYLLSRHDFMGQNDTFFEYIYEHSGNRITKDEIEEGSKKKLGKTPSTFATELGFQGIPRRMFFPSGVPATGFIFNKDISREEFDALGITEDELESYLESLEKLS